MPAAANRLENLRTLRFANLDGAFATAFATLVGGTFLVGFVKELGGSDLWIGVLTAIPSLLGIVQIPGAILGRASDGYKGFVLPGGLLWRVFYLPMIALPLIALAADAKLWVLGGAISIASLCVLVVNPTYNDWLAAIVPESSRGWFFSRRNAIMAGVGTAVGIAGGLVLDAMRARGRVEEGFALVFGLGLLCAAASFIFFLRMRDLPRPDRRRQRLSDALAAFRAPFANKSFRPVVLFFAAFIFGQAFPGNLFGAYALETLKLPFTLIQLTAAAQAGGSILAGRFWGYLADKYGNRPLLLLLGIGIALTPGPWLFTQPGDLTWNAAVLLLGHVYSGIVWGGVSVCQFNLLLATADPKDRATYLGVGMAAQAIVGGLAPLVGAQVMLMARIEGGALWAYQVIFWSTMGLRAVCVLFLLPVREPGSIGIRETVRKLRSLTPSGYAALRSLSVSRNAEQREEAIQAVASRNFSIAAEEIIQALHDPSPRVRRQAAAALADLGDPSAVAALVHQLDDHPDLVEDETIEALGALGDPSSVPALIRHLHSPKSSTRRAAAKALGRIGHPSAEEPLARAAADPGDADLRRASLQALRMLGAAGADEVIVGALLDPYPSVRIAAAEAVAELRIASALSHLRASLAQFDDEAESEVAYALGCIGGLEDVPAILLEAEKCVSITTRRRCLLGVARLLGVENAVYRLLLMDGMTRDAAVMEQWAPLTRRNKRLLVALNRYAAGDERGALERLAQAMDAPALRALAARPVEESFLVAAAWVRRQSRSRKRPG